MYVCMCIFIYIYIYMYIHIYIYIYIMEALVDNFQTTLTQTSFTILLRNGNIHFFEGVLQRLSSSPVGGLEAVQSARAPPINK